MQALAPPLASRFNGSHTRGPQFGNAWQRLMSGVSKGGQHLNSLIQTGLSKGFVGDTYQSLLYSKDFKLHVGEIWPTALTASILLYILGQEQHENDDPKAPLRLLTESAATYALTTYTSYVIPVLGVLGLAYTAGQQETLLDKVKHSGSAGLGLVGSLIGVWGGLGFNMDKTQRDVTHTLKALPEARAYLKTDAPKIINTWEPEIPDTLKTAPEINAYKTKLRKDILQHLKDFETKLAGGHEALLKTYHTNPKGGTLAGRVRLREQLKPVFSELWSHLQHAHEALSSGVKTTGLEKTLQLSNHLEILNTGYVRAGRWANPIVFGVLGSLAFQLLVPAWEHLCDWLLSNRLGHATLKVPAHTLLNHHDGSSHGAGHSNALWQQHDRFNAFAEDGLPQDPFAGNTHQMAQEVFLGEKLITDAVRGPH